MKDTIIGFCRFMRGSPPESVPLPLTRSQKWIIGLIAVTLGIAAIFIASADGDDVRSNKWVIVATLAFPAFVTFLGIMFATDRGLQNAKHVIDDTRRDNERKATAAIIAEMSFNLRKARELLIHCSDNIPENDDVLEPVIMRNVAAPMPEPSTLVISANATDLGRLPLPISRGILDFYDNNRDAWLAYDECFQDWRDTRYDIEPTKKLFVILFDFLNETVSIFDDLINIDDPEIVDLTVIELDNICATMKTVTSTCVFFEIEVPAYAHSSLP